MARFNFDISGGLFSEMDVTALTKGLADKMLKAGAPILEKSVKDAVEKHKRTGIVSSSIKSSKVRTRGNGGKYIVVSPTGESAEMMDNEGRRYRRKKPVRNAEILAYLEYGTSKQPQHRTLSTAVQSCQKDVKKVMQDVFNEEIGKR